MCKTEEIESRINSAVAKLVEIKHFKGISALILTVAFTLIIKFLGGIGYDSYKIEFDSKKLKASIESIIRTNDEYKNIPDDFIKTNDFSEDTMSKLYQLFNDDENLNKKELLQLYFVVKDRYPLHYINYDIKRESERWSGALYLTFIAILTYWLTWSILYLMFDGRGCKGIMIRSLGDQGDRLKTVVDNHFESTIRKFAEAHKGFINGMYDNYPHNFTYIFDEGFKNCAELKNGTRSLYIWMKSINVKQYADFATDLLSLTKKSIYSTTYYDNEDLIIALKNDNVIAWINGVNDKNNENEQIDVKRIHMFKNNGTKEDGIAYATNKDINDFIGLIKADQTALNNYRDLYISGADEYKVWHDFNDIMFYGEYIIFDNQIMIKYDEDFKTLELYVGKIVAEHSSGFRQTHRHFMSKEDMLEKLNGS